MNSQRRVLMTVIGIVTVGGAIYLAAGAEQTAESQLEASSESGWKRVKVAAVEAAREHRELRFSGVTRAARRARLAFAIGGRVTARPVGIGDRVREGQLLARLDDRELRNAVDSARAALAELRARRVQSERDRDRARQLAAAKATTREELEHVGAALDALVAAEASASARLRESERLLGEARLQAPFAGTVTEVLLESGEFALAGRPVVILSGDGAVEIEVEVPESMISAVAAGDEVTVALPVLGRAPATGRIKSVGRTAAGPGRLFPIVATLAADERVASGMTAELVLRLALDDGLTLPVEAVVNPGGRRSSVFRLVRDPGDDGATGRVEKVPVTVEGLVGDRVIVRGELGAGELVVVGGQRGLLDGERVEVE